MRVPAAIAPVVDLIFPPRCPLCGAALSDQSGLCAACWQDLVIPGDPSCVACQRPFPDTMPEGGLCAPCLAEPPVHDGIAAGTLYTDASRKLILTFKHGHRIALAPMMARLMLARLGGRIDSGWIVTPVPLHRWRLWSRGFNQSALLAGEIARAHGARMLVDGLQRTRRTPTLGGLGRKARARALAGAIRVDAKAAERIRGADVLLVDDVLTSGTTSNACVRALKRAGARKVIVTCFARVLDEAAGTAGVKAASETMHLNSLDGHS
jgi:ComF family protein